MEKSKQKARYGITVFAHRGYSSEYPDNTPLSFRKAIELGADYIEFDVRRTADGELVIFHDSTTKKVWKYEKRIEEMMLEEVQSIELPENQHIPTLEELFKICGGKIGLQMELKGVGVAEKAFKMVKEYGLGDEVFYSAFNEVEIWKLKELDPDCYCAAVIDSGRYTSPDPFESFKWMIYKAEKLGTPAVHIPFQSIDEGFVDYAKERGLVFNAWTVDAPVIWESLIEMGVDGIFTNDPKGLIDLLKKNS